MSCMYKLHAWSQGFYRRVVREAGKIEGGRKKGRHAKHNNYNKKARECPEEDWSLEEGEDRLLQNRFHHWDRALHSTLHRSFDRQERNMPLGLSSDAVTKGFWIIIARICPGLLD